MTRRHAPATARHLRHQVAGLPGSVKPFPSPRRSFHTEGAAGPTFCKTWDRHISQVSLPGHSEQRQPLPCPGPGATLFNTFVFGISLENSYLL